MSPIFSLALVVTLAGAVGASFGWWGVALMLVVLALADVRESYG